MAILPSPIPFCPPECKIRFGIYVPRAVKKNTYICRMRILLTLMLGLTLGWAQRLMCGTDMLYEKALREDPNLAKMRALLEEATDAFISRNGSNLRTQSGCPESDYVIPVVVHIIHSGAGQSDSLPISRVLFQMEQLFDDFRKRPYSKGYSSGVDTRIEFSLATKDPSGNPHPGVTYTHYSAAGLSAPRVGVGNSDATTMKNNVGWPRNKYLNIWVIKCIYSSNPNQCDILGFATFPGMGSTDQGVVVVSSYFGLPNQSQTTTHEIGHYLSLYHTFQNSCAGTTNNNCSSGGDRVCDSPPTRQANYYSARRQNTCSENISANGGDRPDQVRNYMDYLDDPSLDIFTEGQRQRMTDALYAAPDRNPLWQSSNLQATGTGPYGRLKANFALKGCDQPPCYVCPGQQLELTSYSMGKPHQFLWEIRQGGTVISSSNTGPCTQLNAPTTPGTYDIHLQITNQVGTAETTYTGFLIVRDPAQARSYPFSEGFEATAFPPTGWVRQNPDFATGNSNLTWERFSSTGRGSFGASNAMARIRNFVYYNRTQRDQLITPLINIPASAQNPAIEFDMYYRALYWENTSANQYGYLYGDTLAVYISDDCGSTWQRLYYKGGEDLDVTGSAIQAVGRNINPSTDQAVPPTGSNTAWRHEVISIPDAYKGKKVLIRFENITEMGNNLYIDSIQVRDNLSSSVLNASARPSLSLTPNPTSQEATLLIKNAEGLPLQWTLYNSLGQMLSSGEITLSSPEGRVTLPTSSLPAGLYLVKTQLGHETTLLRLVKE